MMEEAGRWVAAAERFLVDPSPHIAAWRQGFSRFQTASEVDHSLFELTRGLRVTRRMLPLDRAVRCVDTDPFPAWRQLTAAKLADGELASATPLVRIAAMHRDGRVRAAAVRLLAADAHRSLGDLAVRCVDPAPPVRAAAVAAVVPILSAVPVREVVGQELVLLAPQMRRMAPEVADAAEATLLADPGATVAAMSGWAMSTAALLADSERIRTVDLLACVGHHGPAYDVLWRAGIQRCTPTDALWFLERTRGSLPTYQLVWLAAARAWPRLDEVALSPATLGRLRLQRVAQLLPVLTRERRWSGSQPRNQVLGALLDERSSPRQLAQRLLTHAGLDVAAYYRPLLDLSPTAVIGLGEVGTPADAHAITHHLSSAEPLFRHAAVNALKLHPDVYLPALLTALDDPDLRVARAAARRLRRHVEQAGVERIMAIGSRREGSHAADQATYLLLQGRTDQILERLLGTPDRVRDHRDFVLAVLSEWSRRSWRRQPQSLEAKQQAVLEQLRQRYANDAAVLDLLNLNRPDDREPVITGLLSAWHRDVRHSQ